MAAQIQEKPSIQDKSTTVWEKQEYDHTDIDFPRKLAEFIKKFEYTKNEEYKIFLLIADALNINNTSSEETLKELGDLLIKNKFEYKETI